MLATKRSSEMSYLLIWFKAGAIYAAGIADPPEAFAHGGNLFHSISDYLGDVDYLRDKQRRLVGFSYILGNANEHEEALHQSLLAQSKCIRVKDGMLMILFEDGPFEIDCVQAVGSRIYRTPTDQLMLAIPNCGFGKLSFNLIMNHSVQSVDTESPGG
jgi:hypothetical protein